MSTQINLLIVTRSNITRTTRVARSLQLKQTSKAYHSTTWRTEREMLLEYVCGYRVAAREPIAVGTEYFLRSFVLHITVPASSPAYLSASPALRARVLR